MHHLWPRSLKILKQRVEIQIRWLVLLCSYACKIIQICRLTANQTCSTGSHDSIEQFLMCAWQIQNKNGEKSKLGNAEIWMDKLEVANGQTGGGTKSGPALNWIDLRKGCQGKSFSWHPAEFKKVCKYGAAMHIEGARSLWRKIIRSGGLRSSNWLSSQLENLTTSASAALPLKTGA